MVIHGVRFPQTHKKYTHTFMIKSQQNEKREKPRQLCFILHIIRIYVDNWIPTCNKFSAKPKNLHLHFKGICIINKNTHLRSAVNTSLKIHYFEEKK